MRQVEHHEHQPTPHHGCLLEVALVGLDDPLNVGQAFRLSLSLGVRHLHLLDGTPAPPNAKLNRTARGAQHHLAFTEADFATALIGFRQNLLRVIAVEYATHAQDIRELAHEAQQLSQNEPGVGTVLLFGNEAHGLSKAQLSQCDAVGILPMYGSVSSFNVATAIAIATWEFVR